MPPPGSTSALQPRPVTPIGVAHPQAVPVPSRSVVPAPVPGLARSSYAPAPFSSGAFSPLTDLMSRPSGTVLLSTDTSAALVRLGVPLALLAALSPEGLSGAARAAADISMAGAPRERSVGATDGNSATARFTSTNRSVAAALSRLVANLEITTTGGLPLGSARALNSFLQIFSTSVRDGDAPLVLQLLGQVSSASGLQELNGQLALYQSLSKGGQEFVRRSLQGQALSLKAFEAAVGRAIRFYGIDPSRGEAVQVPVVESAAPANRLPTARPSQFRSHAFEQFVEALPAANRTEWSAFFKGLTTPATASSPAVAGKPRTVTVVPMERPPLDARAVRLIASATPQVVDKVLMAAVHPALNARLFVVALLRQLANREGSLLPLHMQYLLILARDTRSLEVRMQAIKVLLDMGQGRNRGRDPETEALLHKVGFGPLLRKLLNAKGPAALIVRGLALLDQGWSFLSAAQRNEFSRTVVRLAETHGSEMVVNRAVEVLMNHFGDLHRAVKMKLLQKDLHLRALTLASALYERRFPAVAQFAGVLAG